MRFTTVVVAALLAAACGTGAPDEAAFREADRLIIVNKGQTAFGNSAEATRLAEEFSSRLKLLRTIGFTERSKGAPSISRGEFLTYCALTDSGALFLVHVPDFRNFKEDAQASLLDLAWLTARRSVENVHKERDVKLGVGLRGALLYGGIAIGSSRSEQPEQKDTTGTVDVTRFYEFFRGIPAAPGDTAKD